MDEQKQQENNEVEYSTENSSTRSAEQPTEQQLEQQIESVLFWKSEPMSFSQLSKILNKKESEIAESIERLELQLKNRGVSLVVNDGQVGLVTSPKSSEIIEKLQHEELTKDLSKAALETLSIILYRGPIKRSEIDYIRGVNSQFTLRILLIRGLIEKKQDPKDERVYIYSTSLDTLSHMGISKVEDLPDFKEVNEDIDNFIENSADEPDEESNDESTKENNNVGENQE
jgi:segregation and condensation protein B